MKEMKHVKRGMTDEEVNNLTKEELTKDLETLKENLDEMSRKTKRIEKLKEFFTWFEEEIINRIILKRICKCRSSKFSLKNTSHIIERRLIICY